MIVIRLPIIEKASKCWPSLLLKKIESMDFVYPIALRHQGVPWPQIQ